MDPMNWYNSKPNVAEPYQAAKSPGLIPQPSGPAPQGMKIGGAGGGNMRYEYLPNRFSASGGGGPNGQGLPPNVPTPSVPPGGGAMTFGGGPGLAPGAMGQTMGGVFNHLQPMPQPVAPPQQAQMAQTAQGPMRNQMARIGAIRGNFA